MAQIIDYQGTATHPAAEPYGNASAARRPQRLSAEYDFSPPKGSNTR